MSSQNYLIFDLLTMTAWTSKNEIFLVEPNKITFLDLLQAGRIREPQLFSLIAVNIFLKFTKRKLIEHEVAPHFGAYKENVPPTHGLGFSEFFANFLFFSCPIFWMSPPPSLPPFKIILFGCTYLLWWPGSTIRCWRYALCINDTRVWCARAHPQHASVQFNTLEILLKNITSFIFLIVISFILFLENILLQVYCVFHAFWDPCNLNDSIWNQHSWYI